jgi:hypothetical protein
MRAPALIALAVAALAPSAALAIDHNNLDLGRPIRLEDAYPVSHGEFVLEFGAGFAAERNSPDRFFGTGDLLYGALPNFQLGLSGFGSTHPHDIDEDTKSGDLQLSGLYNFNQETLTLPAIAAKLTLNFPTGVDSSGVDAEIKAIFTKSIDIGDVPLSFHLNVGYEFLSGTSSDEEDGRWKVAFGPSIPLGAPHSTRMTLVADIFAEEGALRNSDETIGAEVGLRYQLTERIVLDAGVGTEFAGDDRSPVFATIGVSFSF